MRPVAHGSSILVEPCRSNSVFPSMNEHTPHRDGKMFAGRRRQVAPASLEAVGRALLAAYPAVHERELPEDMKKLLARLDWQERSTFT